MIRLLHRPGHFVVEGQPLADVWPAAAAPGVARALGGAHATGPHRTLTQDLSFAVDQLVEIAIRALSPAVNDTFTALACIDWLGDGLCKIAGGWQPATVHRDAAGRVRVITVTVSFRRLVERAHDKIRQASRGMPAVMIRQLDGLAKVMAYTTSAEQREVLARAGGDDPARERGVGARGGAIEPTCAAATTRCCTAVSSATMAAWPDERGHLKVFIGMAPGVGKTYRMLQEGVAEAESGRDVAIGYLEPHGRDETVAQAEGLEIVPRRQVLYRGKPLEEMDLPAVLARSPELCLIDELAHTNAPGVEHEKRYEDVRDVLDAGIDVFSTVNVQHLESLNDQVTQLTGARVRETIPDEVLSAADEVVLIDLTPEALIARLRAGKVYRPERVQAALNNFFKIENLSALRETALRQVAEDVEVKRLVRSRAPIVASRRGGCRGRAEPAPQAIAERLLALATLGAGLRARRAPRVALGPAPGRRARRARRAPAGPPAEPRGPQAARGAAPARLRCSARACASRRATTSPRSRSTSRVSSAAPTC